MDVAPIDIDPTVVAFVTALWQQDPETAEQIIRDFHYAVVAQGESSFEALLDVLCSLADMVLSVLAGTAQALDVDPAWLTDEALAQFGRRAAGGD